MNLKTYTLIHVLISLLAIFSGLVVVGGLLAAKRLDGWTKLFLATTILTSATGFFFPLHGVTPALVVGAVSLVALGVATFARYQRKLAGVWRNAYVVCAVLALYLNVLVLIVQVFDKIPALKAISPTQHEPPFKITQLAVLVAFIISGVVAGIRFRAESVSPLLETRI
ncbi:MAG: hypothetical protein ACLQVY_20920 [Limisphaerales bacterium]